MNHSRAYSFDESAVKKQEWNKEGEIFVRDSIAKHGTVDWRAVDENRVRLLPEPLARRGLVILREDDRNSELRVEVGSL